MHASSVIFIREHASQLTGSGCCGRLEGDFVRRGQDQAFPERRAAMEALGPLYQAIRARFGASVEVEIVDPRNAVGLLLLLLRDFRRYGVGLLEALRTLGRISVQGVIVDGRLVSTGPWPTLAELTRHLEGRRAGKP